MNTPVAIRGDPQPHRRSRQRRRGSEASTCSPGATSTTTRRADPRSTPTTSPPIWAQSGLAVTHRTSASTGRPAEAERDGYRVVRRGSRYLVFPRAAVAEAVHRYGTVLTAWWRSGTACPSCRRVAARSADDLAAPHPRPDVGHVAPGARRRRRASSSRSASDPGSTATNRSSRCRGPPRRSCSELGFPARNVPGDHARVSTPASHPGAEERRRRWPWQSAASCR